VRDYEEEAMLHLQRTLGSQAIGAWERDRSIILKWQQTMWIVRRRSRIVDPLAQWRSHHRRRRKIL
jgi:hypothetical protein